MQPETRELVSTAMGLTTEQADAGAHGPSRILIRRDGTDLYIEHSCAPIHDRDGSETGAVRVFHDVSEARGLSRRLAHQAAHDNLTDLPNRGLLSDRLAQAVAVVHRHHKSLALLYLDVDRFKHINDSLGHAVGDRLLQSIASRLSACVRTSCTCPPALELRSAQRTVPRRKGYCEMPTQPCMRPRVRGATTTNSTARS